MFNILYLIWFENINSAILRYQVFELLIENQKRSNTNSKIYILAFQPFYKVKKEKVKLKDVILEFNNNRIVFKIIPCLKLPFLNIFSGKFYILPFIFLQSFFYILYFLITKRISLIHSRSYPITFTALILKLFFKFKLIFDPRSNFPEENNLHKNTISISFIIWKKIEKLYLINSDYVIATSISQLNHFKNISIFGNYVYIPNNVNTEKFKPDSYLKNKFKNELKISNNSLVFCYSGSLNNLWNNPDIYSRFILKLRKLKIKFVIIFITNDIEILKFSLNKYNILNNEYRIINTFYNSIPDYLTIGDIGLNLMLKKDDRLSIKTVEYLSMNLPVITNYNVKGAVDVVNKYSVGYVIKNDNFEDLSNSKIFEDILNIKNCREIAYKYFSTKIIAEKLNCLYLACK